MRSTLVVVIVLLGCAALPAAAQEALSPEPVQPPMDGVLSQATNLPDRFTPMPEAEPVPFGDRACPIGYRDDRNGTALRLVRSVSSKITRVEDDRRITEEVSYGDYWIPGENPYGVTLGRALRIDCVSARGVGIVERFKQPDNRVMAVFKTGNEMRVNRTDPDRRLTPAEAQRILDRAAALDSIRDGTVNVADLRAAALEAGISADSFDQAALSPDSSTDDRRRRVAQRISFLVIALIAISLLASQFIFRGGGGPAPSVVVPEAAPQTHDVPHNENVEAVEQTSQYEAAGKSSYRSTVVKVLDGLAA